MTNGREETNLPYRRIPKDACSCSAPAEGSITPHHFITGHEVWPAFEEHSLKQGGRESSHPGEPRRCGFSRAIEVNIVGDVPVTAHTLGAVWRTTLHSRSLSTALVEAAEKYQPGPNGGAFYKAPSPWSRSSETGQG